MKVGMLLGSLALTLTVSLFILVVFRARSRYTAAKVTPLSQLQVN